LFVLFVAFSQIVVRRSVKTVFKLQLQLLFLDAIHIGVAMSEAFRGKNYHHLWFCITTKVYHFKRKFLCFSSILYSQKNPFLIVVWYRCTFKAEQGVMQFYFRKIPLINKKFWWFRLFLIRCGCRDI